MKPLFFIVKLEQSLSDFVAFIFRNGIYSLLLAVLL